MPVARPLEWEWYSHAELWWTEAREKGVASVGDYFGTYVWHSRLGRCSESREVPKENSLGLSTQRPKGIEYIPYDV